MPEVVGQLLGRTWAREGASLEPLCAVRLRNAMGSSCAWHPDGFHVALTFTSGDVAVVVRGLWHLPLCERWFSGLLHWFTQCHCLQLPTTLTLWCIALSICRKCSNSTQGSCIDQRI